jgi:hypothetical protein
MANIQLKNLTQLSMSGLDLFTDSESFIQDLSEHELELKGGCTIYCPSIIITIMQMYFV